MDKSAIKNFAVWARKKLIEDVRQKAFEIGITEGATEEVAALSSDLSKVRGKTLDKNELSRRKSLVYRIREKGYREVIEEAAYTWFNRFIALRFMEINDYLPSGIRVLSSVESGKTEPDIIGQFEYIDLGLNDRELNSLHDMQDSNDTDGLYRFLIIKQCNKLNEILPGLFEKIEDYTEILLPSNLLSEGSFIRRLVSDIAEEDYREQVEIIGWMYQYYISEKKDEVFEGLKKNIKITKENIPAATQLFTPDWIVKYMVENSLGRLWLEGHQDDGFRDGWKYYLEEAGQETDVQRQLDKIREHSKNISPEDIKVLDPSMGSGHILVYAFDVLYEIYKSAGYSERDIPKLILEKNLYGLEIDDRAAQLAYFAVMMKARSKNRRIFREKIDPNICSIQESNGFPEEAIDLLSSPGRTGHESRVRREDIEYLLNVFIDAKEYGSILDVKPVDFDAIEKRLEEIENGGFTVYELQIRNAVLNRIPKLVKQARIMGSKYFVVCTNPPYMGIRNMNSSLAAYLEDNYPLSKNDLFTVFIEKGFEFLRPGGYNAMVTMQSWMFLPSFEDIRREILKSRHIATLVHMDNMVMGIAFGTAAAVFYSRKIDLYNGKYIHIGLNDLNEYNEPGTFPVINEKYSIRNTGDFEGLPGSSIAYWITDSMKNSFKSGKALDRIAEPRQGMATSDNNRFLRLWHEVCIVRIGFGLNNAQEAQDSRLKWFPYNKGGKYRKWYGNNEYIVNWENDGMEIKEYAAKLYRSYSRTIKNTSYYFKSGLSWTLISSSGLFGVRYIPDGFIFDVNGMMLFIDEDNLTYILALMNSKVALRILEIVNSTMAFQVGDIKKIPIIFLDKYNEAVKRIGRENIEISKYDWDSFETSWNFQRHPILEHKQNASNLEQAFTNWSGFAKSRFDKLKSNEEELNRIFIDIYGLQGEMGPSIEDKDVTIRKADRVRDIKYFISYAVGCMLGRYSIDADGLIFAGGVWEDKWRNENGEWKVRKTVGNGGNITEDNWVSTAYGPDNDNIIPILDDEYFDDDIVYRFVEFVRVAFGEGSLEENLDYIAETIGKKSSETSRQAIRKYFLKDFYKDHVQMYQKKPIYWLFDSGSSGGFKALIYMHRYDEYTAAKVRTDYLHRLQHMYEAEYSRLDIVIDSNSSEREKGSARKKKERLQKQMAECIEFDQVIAHAANQRIKIDLDNGVAANYAKFQNIEVHQGEGRKPLKANLLAKI